MHIYTYGYVYIYLYVCVCVRVYNKSTSWIDRALEEHTLWHDVLGSYIRVHTYNKQT